MKLVETILRFEHHLRQAQESAKRDLTDYFVYTALAMECFQAVNALIDLAERVVVRKRLGVPSSYREIFEILREHGWISDAELQTAKRLMFVRNVIAHEYQKLRPEDLSEAVTFLAAMHDFVQRVAQRAKELGVE